MLGATLHFGPHRLFGPHGPLFSHGVEVKLPPRALAVLWTLASQSGQVITKAVLLDAVWSDTVVCEAALAFQIGVLRQALADDARKPRYIKTVHRVGYRFISQVTATSPSRDLPPPSEAGIGKTALVETNLTGRLGAPGLAVGPLQCVEHDGAAEAFLPLLEALARLCPAPHAERVLDILRRCAPRSEARARINRGPQKGALVESTSAPRLLDLRATAVYLGISEWTVRDLEAAGTLRRVRVPMRSAELRKLLFDREDLDRLIGVWKGA